MSAKRMGFLERNAGAIAIALAAIGAAGLVVRGWMTSNAVTVPPDETVTPGEIDRRLADEARAILDRLESDAAAPLDLPDLADGRARLAGRLDEGVAPAPALPMPTAARGPSVDGMIDAPAVVFNVPRVPAPEAATAATHLGTIADRDLEAVPALAARFEAGTPADLVWNTAAARVDLAALRAQFAAAAPDRPAAPASWSFDRPALVVDVVLRRQAEQADGTWSDPVVPGPMPGRFSVRAALAAPIDAAARDRIVTALVEPGAELELLQPAFYELRGGSWIEPGSEVDALDDDPLRRRLGMLIARRDELARYVKLHFGVDPGDHADDGGGGGGGGVPGPPPGGFAPGGTERKRDREPPGASGPDREVLERLLRQIRQLNEQIGRLEARVEPAPAPARAVDGGDDRMWIWAHDITAEPGRVYRYALQLRIYNPLFGRGRNLVDQQQSLAEAFTLDSPWSPWSAPVATDRFTRLWITRAEAAPGLGLDDLGLVRAEVDRYFDGRRWRRVFRIRPGDAIGGVRTCTMGIAGGPGVEVDFGTGLTVVDILEPLEPAWGISPQVLLQDFLTGEVVDLRDPAVEAGGAGAAGPIDPFPCHET